MIFLIRAALAGFTYVLLCAVFAVTFDYLEDHDTNRAGTGAAITSLLAMLLFRLLEF